MKDLDILRSFLEIEVSYVSQGYLVSQLNYISNILEQACIYDTRVTNSPLELNVKYTSFDGVPLPYPW